MKQTSQPFHILLCTDASPACESAAALLRLFCFPPGSHCTLLGLGQSGKASAMLFSEFDRIAAIMEGEFEIHKEVIEGKPFESISRFVQSRHFDLVALGDPPGLHSRPFQPGFLHTHQLAERLASSRVKPLLLARGRKPRLNSILFCSSGEEPARHTLETGANLLVNSGAHVNVLHVMSQLAFESSKFSEDLYYNAENAIQSGSREGLHLTKALEMLSQAGMKGQATPRLRHGLVVDEVMAEIKEAQIDLLVIGSHRQPGQNRLLNLLLEDVARDLVNEAHCSVLIV
jgi:nucleotide-binding universal stress UspA family protein